MAAISLVDLLGGGGSAADKTWNQHVLHDCGGPYVTTTYVIGQSQVTRGTSIIPHLFELVNYERNLTNLLPQPFDIELTDVSSIE